MRDRFGKEIAVGDFLIYSFNPSYAGPTVGMVTRRGKYSVDITYVEFYSQKGEPRYSTKRVGYPDKAIVANSIIPDSVKLELVKFRG